jgi:hypothetical protein
MSLEPLDPGLYAPEGMRRDDDISDNDKSLDPRF